jgi:hypothetical protein
MRVEVPLIPFALAMPLRGENKNGALFRKACI